MNYRILVIGASWHGSDCTGIARGFRRLGHVVELIGDDEFFPKTGNSLTMRLIRRVFTFYFLHLFNTHIIRQVSITKPHFIVVFKGNYILLETFRKIRINNIPLYNFFPDISFFAHPSVHIESYQYYNHIFTTKRHGSEELNTRLGLHNSSYLQHGFDPDVHKPIPEIRDTEDMLHDVSFIGGWSSGKEIYLKDLVTGLPNIDLSIWGDRWGSCQSLSLNAFIKGFPVYGDFYALAIRCCKINLGLLQDQQGSAPVGDSVTSRTFHIPASGGFLLHERNEEVLEYFEEGKEIACFDTPEELIEKVRYYLVNEEERIQIAKAGYERCIKENSWAHRAQVIIDKFECGNE